MRPSTASQPMVVFRLSQCMKKAFFSINDEAYEMAQDLLTIAQSRGHAMVVADWLGEPVERGKRSSADEAVATWLPARQIGPIASAAFARGYPDALEAVGLVIVGARWEMAVEKPARRAKGAKLPDDALSHDRASI
jgi:hypothetical protein